MKNVRISAGNRFSISFIAILLATVAGGWVFTDYLTRLATGDVRKDAGDANSVISSAIKHELAIIQGSVKALSGSPFIARALVSRKIPDIETANGALDRYNKAAGSSVAFIMDRRGITIASSNRNSRESFVGQSYGLRPDFQVAIGGNAAFYFATVPATGNRAFYASAPVKAGNGRVIGVAAMKHVLDDIENRLGQYEQWFLVSPEGVIFMSSRADARLKSLWPLDNDISHKIQLPRQFGTNIITPLLPSPPIDGSLINLDGNSYLFSRNNIGYGGWSVFVLEPTKRIQDYQSFGILLSTFLGMLFIGSHMTIYFFRRTANLIREGEKRFVDVMHSSKDMILLIGSDKFIDCNEAAVHLLGYKNRAEVLMTHPSELSPPEQPDGRKSFEKANEMMKIAFEKGFHRFEWMHRKAGGEDFPVEVSLTPIVLKGNNALYCVWRDIAEIKKAERKLKEQEELYRLLTEKSFAGIYVVQEGVLTFLNSKAIDYTGYPAEEIIGTRTGDLVHPDDVAKQSRNAHDMLNGLRKTPYEFRIVTKQGETRWIMETVVPFVYKDRRAILANCMDVTTQKLAEEELSNAYKKVSSMQANIIQQQKMASIGQLSAGISHEINNPLGFIKGNLEMLKTYMTNLDMIINKQDDMIQSYPSAVDFAGTLKEERKRLKIDYILQDVPKLIEESLIGADRIGTIVRDLSIFSAEEDAEYHIADVNDGLMSAIDVMRGGLPEKVDIVTSLGNLPRTRCNIGQLRHAFMAVLGNALQAVGDRGVVRVDSRREDSFIIVSISDTGIGISDDLKDRIFEPFFTTREVGQGMGLGLSTTYDIIKKHSGEIMLESEEGKGSMFIMRLPITTASVKGTP
jgi:PAS domain S-box-containing protein